MNSPAQILPETNTEPKQLSRAGQVLEPSSWQAFLKLRIDKKAQKTRLAQCRHRGPLYVQRAFYPEGPFLPHIYLLHPPGGVVSGDLLEIDLNVQEEAHALFTTPGAGRVYRARKDKAPQGQNVRINVAQGGCAEWFPLENILYPNANAKLTTKIYLEEGAHFSGWDITTLGLPAQKAFFTSGHLNQRLEIWLNDEPKLIECLAFDGGHEFSSSRAGLQNFPITGTFVAGPFSASPLDSDGECLLNKLREVGEKERPRDLKSMEGTTFVNGFVVARYLGNCSESAKNLFTQYWQLLRPALIGRPACHPRIWST